MLPSSAVTTTLKVFGPPTRADLPETTRVAAGSLATASTETLVVRAGRVIDPPSTTDVPLILNVFKLLSDEGGVTYKVTV